MLMSFGHQSPIEHVSFTFAIEGVSRVLTHQLVRHRIASFSQQSQRYVKLEQFEYIIPPAIANNPEALAIFKDAMEADQLAYEGIVSHLEADHQSTYEADGIPQDKARKMAEKEPLKMLGLCFLMHVKQKLQ